MPIKAIIREARKEAGLFQSTLGQRAGCSQQTIVDIESGAITKSSFLPEICDVLGLDYHRMMENPDAPVDSLRRFRFSYFPVLNDDQVYSLVHGNPDAFNLVPGEDMKALPSSLKASDRAFWIVVKTDLMEPDLRIGDFALVDPDRDEKSGGILAVFMSEDQSPTIRRFVLDGSREELVATKTNDRVCITGSDAFPAFKIGSVIESVRIL